MQLLAAYLVPLCLSRSTRWSAQLLLIWLKPQIAPAVWEWKGQALDEGDHAAMWLSEYLGKDVRLLRYAGMPSRVEMDPKAHGMRDTQAPLSSIVTFHMFKLSCNTAVQGSRRRHLAMAIKIQACRHSGC